MKYLTIPPSRKLAPYVRMFWVYEGEASAAQPYIYRGYADGCTEMVFHFRGVYDQLIGDERVGSIAAGIHAQTRHHTRFVVDCDWASLAVTSILLPCRNCSVSRLAILPIN
jgi:hypothetical protein